jgi:two-component system cell cycle sensor histidine kinase/response regulator CckA
VTKTTLLVIDDEPVILELVGEVMDEHHILTAETIAQARKLVTGGAQFDVAIVDKNLPDGNGLDAVRWLRETRPDCEALVMTGYPSMDSAVEAIAAGATDYLIKPMRDIAEMRLRVNNAVERVQRRRAAEALTRALKESEERYRELFSATPDAVVVLDAAARTVIDCNVAAERLYQVTRDELLGKRADELTAKTPEPIVLGSSILRHERRADGTAIPVEVRTTTARHGGRDILVHVVRDVSERERAAQEKAALEQRLVRAGKLEALGKLAAGIAHDFNNLLCVMGVGTELAAESLVDDLDGAKRELEQIAATVQSATALTRQLLAFSGRHLTRPTNVDVNARVEMVARMLERTLGARIKLATSLSPVPVTVLIDPSQLEQVLTNLAVNARDAMPGGGSITISTEPAPQNQSPGVMIRVRDSGTGIPPEILADIFEPFFTTKGPEKGTGLGLATVHEIVKRAGGSIGVKSKIGEGTTFEVWLPCTEGAAYETVRMSIAVPAGRGEHVLLVEDDPRVRDVTRRVLVNGGYTVHEASDGEDAVAFAAGGGKVDVVLADLELPGISGVECVQQVSAAQPNARILYTSGMASDPRATAGAVRGATFLAKPYTPDELLRSLRKALDSRR